MFLFSSGLDIVPAARRDTLADIDACPSSLPSRRFERIYLGFARFCRPNESTPSSPIHSQFIQLNYLSWPIGICSGILTIRTRMRGRARMSVKKIESCAESEGIRHGGFSSCSSPSVVRFSKKLFIYHLVVWFWISVVVAAHSKANNNRINFEWEAAASAKRTGAGGWESGQMYAAVSFLQSCGAII